MFRFKKDMEKELDRIRELKKLLPVSLEKPRGHVIVRSTANGDSYSLRTYYVDDRGVRKSKTVFLGALDAEEVKRAKGQFYMYELARRLLKDEKILEESINRFQEYDNDSINRALGKGLMSIPFDGIRNPARNNGTDKLNRWANENYERLEMAFDGNNFSISGKRLRSKSEVIIANVLDANGIPYRVEEKLSLVNPGGVKVFRYPDFTIMTPTGKQIYWEHFGLIKDENYSSRIGEKIRLYAYNGIMLGDNFVISVDTVDGDIDSRYIQEQVDLIKVKYFK